MRIAAIIPAAGKGKRLRSKLPKAFFLISGKPLLIHTLGRLKISFPFYEMIVAAPAGHLKVTRTLLKRFRLEQVKIVAGGRTRAESVKIALVALSIKCDWVLIHDAARPLISTSLVKKTVAAAKRTGGAICGLPAAATLKKINQRDHMILRTEDRDSFFLAQTPQVFKKSLILERYRVLGKKAFDRTDEAALFDGSKTEVRAIRGEARNIKVTTPEDVELMKYYLKKTQRS